MKNYFIQWLKDLTFIIRIKYNIIQLGLLFVYITLIQRVTFAIILPKYGFVITTDDCYYINDPRFYIWKYKIKKFNFMIGRFYGNAWKEKSNV